MKPKMGCYQILMLIAMGLELTMLGGILTLEILQYREAHQTHLKGIEMPVWTNGDTKCSIWNEATHTMETGPCSGYTKWNQLVECH